MCQWILSSPSEAEMTLPLPPPSDKKTLLLSPSSNQASVTTRSDGRLAHWVEMLLATLTLLLLMMLLLKQVLKQVWI